MAQRIQQKRSSIPGRRPDNSYLNPGELAVNTNSSDPGVFFEGHDGSIIKAGPTAMGPDAPNTEVGYGNGEGWLNTSDQILRHYNASIEEWVKVLSPQYGGSQQLLFVGTEYPEASDDIQNDGSARPFASLNRACIEIARRSILQGREDDLMQAKFTIILLPGTNIARNEPGLGMQEFSETIGRLTKDHKLTLDEIRAFNPVEGGVPLPRGTSIIGLDPFKSNVHPSYYPRWDREGLENGDTPAPRTSIFHASGDSLVHRLTFRDKVKDISVTSITGESPDSVAILETFEPHGLRTFIAGEDGVVLSGDLVNLNYPDLVSRVNGDIQSIPEGLYWAEPLTETTLRLRRTINLEVIYRAFLPGAPSPGSVPNNFLSLTVDIKSHHRLSSVKFASKAILNEYYSKVQQAFADLNFGGVIDDSEVNSAETDIIISLPDRANPSVDDTTHHAPSVIGCYLKSNYGLCGVNADGLLVDGTKEFFVESFSYQALQNDPDVYEVFYDQTWISLKEATWRGLGLDPLETTDEISLKYLIDHVQLENFRYYYRQAKDIYGEDDKSSGLTDPESDTRHYAIVAVNRAIVDALDQKCFGAAVGFWTLNGGKILLDNPTVTLGTEAIKAEGFAGIGSAGGAGDSQKGYEIVGLRRPSVVAFDELKKEDNHELIHLDSSISRITSTEIIFSHPVNTRAILPYSLRPGSVIWVSSLATGLLHRSTIAAGGLSSDGLTVAVESTDHQLNGLDVDYLSLPYIRRFIDPRDPSQRNYYLEVSNTSQTHEPPQRGMVLRYAENQGSNVTTLLEPGRQLDPGENGGWNHLFVIHQSISKEEGKNPNIQHKQNTATNESESYYVSLKLGDSFGPWQNTLDDSPRGGFISYSNRIWSAEYANVSDVTLSPSEEKSEWTLAKRSTVLQKVSEAFIASSYSKTLDPKSNSYTVADQYVRGVKCDDDVYDDRTVIDYDDGSDTLGLGFGSEVSPIYLDPEASHSRAAIERFLTILGYDKSTVDVFLTPQYWNKRDFSIAQFPALDGDGYALSVGNWPVEFNSPSTIQATNVVWELAGDHNISKGLGKYRRSALSQQMRFEAMRSTAWGGHVIVEGQNQFGETLPIEVDSSRKTNFVF